MTLVHTISCPACAAGRLYTLETRQTGGAIRRRRRCNACGHRTTTYEISQELYQQLQTASATLDRVLAALDTQPLAPVPERAPLPCETCAYATRGRCSFDYPEAFTQDAIDCSMYIKEGDTLLSVVA